MRSNQRQCKRQQLDNDRPGIPAGISIRCSFVLFAPSTGKGRLSQHIFQRYRCVFRSAMRRSLHLEPTHIFQFYDLWRTVPRRQQILLIRRQGITGKSPAPKGTGLLSCTQQDTAAKSDYALTAVKVTVTVLVFVMPFSAVAVTVNT